MDSTSSNSPSATIDVDEKPNSTLSPKPSVKSHATRVFQESTVGIVSSIFTIHSNYRRLFKVFISSLCISGFIYHCIAFMNHVLGYPEVVNMSLNRSKTYEWPAYTYCNNNPIRRSVFCTKYSEYCEKPSEAFCKKYSSYCGSNATLIPKESYFYYKPKNNDSWEMLEFGSDPYFPIEFERYIKKDEITGPYLRHDGFWMDRRACYSIHSRVESDQPPLKKTRFDDDESMPPDELLRFHVDETEMINPKSEPGIYFSIHSPFEDVNPLEKGLFLKGGRTYKLHVEMREELLLKEPFESNCTDYDELWEKNNRTGPRTKKMCRDKCYTDSMFYFACLDDETFFFGNASLCDQIISAHSDESFDIITCIENCRDECRSLKYTTEVSIRDYVSFVDLEQQHRHIEVKIYLSNDEVKVLRHSPKYETVDVISSIGGFMGCWLGIALMDILDVFGSIISVCGYAFRKKILKKIKRRKST